MVRTYNGYNLTQEQNIAVDLALSGESLKIEAFAGTGKTSILAAISTFMPIKKGLYLAFNKSNKIDAEKKFPSNTTIKTAHALAFKSVCNELNLHKKLKGVKLKHNQILSLIDFNIDNNYYGISTQIISSIIESVIKKYSHSIDDDINLNHISELHMRRLDMGIELYLEKINKEKINKEKIKDKQHIKTKIINDLLGYSKKLWHELINPDSMIKIDHDVYLKFYALKKPTLNYDFIMFDEAQDASPVMLSIISRQNDSQLIYVGDRNQQIYSWRGAINAMENVQTKNSCNITKSFRFGNEIAILANKVLSQKGEPYDIKNGLKGHEGKKTEVLSSQNNDLNIDVILFRTNTSMIQFLIRGLNLNLKIYITGGVSTIISLLNGLKMLKSGIRSYHQELECYSDWNEMIEDLTINDKKDLLQLIDLANSYGIAHLIHYLENSENFKLSHDLLLSTCHKAKGLEWKRVKLADDFYDITSSSKNNEEINLVYVAITRATEYLDISSCSYLHDLEYR